RTPCSQQGPADERPAGRRDAAAGRRGLAGHLIPPASGRDNLGLPESSDRSYCSAMRLELRHLQVVCSIADYGSLTKAASALGLAPSALTTQLQRIERSIGGALFERDRRGARPTALGDLVLDRARTLLPAVRDLHEEAARLAGNGATAQ